MFCAILSYKNIITQSVIVPTIENSKRITVYLSKLDMCIKDFQC